MSNVQFITVGPDESDQRLDRWLRRQFPQLQQSRIERMCRKGELRIDGARAKPATRVAEGQTVRIPPIPKSGPPAPAAPELATSDVELIQRAVIFRDEYLIAINKPPGLPSQGGTGQRRHVDALSAALQFEADEKPRLVHRLDKDTSGVMVLARNRSVAKKLTEAFKTRATRKIYWAAVAGTPSPKMGTIHFGLVKAPGHGPKGQGERMHAVMPDDVEQTTGAKRATSDYAVISALGNRAAWVGLVPITGRTHQLRVHMAEIGHPIIGDGKYGGSGQENLGDGWGAQLGGEISRKLHLHARSLTLSHPVSGSKLVVTAPLPEHMARTWSSLDWREADAPLDPFEESG